MRVRPCVKKIFFFHDLLVVVGLLLGFTIIFVHFLQNLTLLWLHGFYAPGNNFGLQSLHGLQIGIAQILELVILATEKDEVLTQNIS